MRKIIKNSIKCNVCGEIIVSESVHDFKYCKCGAVSVDGGNEYLRRSYKSSPDDYTELSEYDESESTENGGNIEETKSTESEHPSIARH